MTPESEFRACGECGIALIIFAIVLLLSSCATTQSGSETSAVRHDLSRISESNNAARGDGKQILGNLQGAEYDAKQIRQILNR